MENSDLKQEIKRFDLILIQPTHGIWLFLFPLWTQFSQNTKFNCAKLKYSVNESCHQYIYIYKIYGLYGLKHYTV